MKKSALVVYVALAVLLLAVTGATTTDQSIEVTRNLTSMPLAFTENQGQWDDKVQFRANATDAEVLTDYLWVPCFSDDVVYKINVQTHEVVATIPVGDGPGGVAVGASYVYVTHRYSPTLARISKTGDFVVDYVDLSSYMAFTTAVAVDGSDNAFVVGRNVIGSAYRAIAKIAKIDASGTVVGSSNLRYIAGDAGYQAFRNIGIAVNREGTEAIIPWNHVYAGISGIIILNTEDLSFENYGLSVIAYGYRTQGAAYDASGTGWTAGERAGVNYLVGYDPSPGLTYVNIPTSDDSWHKGLVIDPLDNIWTGMGSGRLIKYDQSGESFDFYDAMSLIGGMAVDRYGFIWVAKSDDDQMVKYDLSGNQVGDPVVVGDFPLGFGDMTGYEVEPLKPAVIPIFIVLGLFDEYSLGDLAGSWKTLKDWLESNGFDHVYPVPDLHVCGKCPETHFSGNAEILAEFIDDKVEELELSLNISISSVDIIGHSMGGQIARRYVSTGHDGSTTWTPRHVRNLIMLGSPCKGSSLCNIGDLEWLRSIANDKCEGPPPAPCEEWPAYDELKTGSMRDFNKEFPDNPATNYVAFWGARGWKWDCYHGGPGNLLLSTPNDGAVSRNSAVRNRWMPIFDPHYEQCHGESWCHSWTGNPNFTYLEDESFFASYIKPILDGSDWSDLPQRDMKDEIAPEIPPQVTHEQYAEMPSGSNATDSFFVEPGSNLTVLLCRSDTLVSLSLESPSGVPYDSTLYPPDSTQLYFSEDLGMIGFNFEGAEDGYWKYTVDAQMATSSPVHYFLMTALDNSVIVNGALSEEYPVIGDTLILNLTVTDGGMGVSGLTATALPIWNETDTASVISLLDDGLTGDGAADDGTYGARITAFDSGSVEYRCHATGTGPSGEISRYMSLEALAVSYICGDVDATGDIPDISDLVYLVNYMFLDGPQPPVMEACDVDGNGSGPDIGDLVYLVNYMFNGGPDLQCP